MAIRNFWISANIDGRETDLEGGPRAKDGGMEVTINQRKNGTISTALTITCCKCYNDDSILETWVKDSNGNVLTVIRTER